jgi:hypothetical protein
MNIPKYIGEECLSKTDNSYTSDHYLGDNIYMKSDITTLSAVQHSTLVQTLLEPS